MFRTRLLSAVILVALALLLILTGGAVLLVASIVISIIGLMELYRALDFHKTLPAAIGYLAAAVYYLLLYRYAMSAYAGGFAVALFLATMILMLFVMVVRWPKYRPEQIFTGVFGVLYVPVMLSCIYLTREMIPGGIYIVWLIFLCSWGCDVGAYCIGMLFGRHKLAPVLSPKKSVEGAVGGVAAAALFTFLYAMLFKDAMGLSIRQVVILTIISAVGAVISMIGDLAASAIKRTYDIKDYGKLIPGHGGILDRFDSVIFTAPVIYYLAFLFV